MTNLPVTLSTLEGQISTLTKQLSPVDENHVAEAVNTLLKAGLTLPSSIKLEDAPKVYEFALQKVATQGLRKAVVKLVRGEYENLSRAFIPTPPELAAIARAESRVIVEDLARLKAKKESISLASPEKRDAAMIERIRAMTTRVRAGSSKTHSETFLEPFSEDQSNYYQKIMTLGDAPRVSAEQMAHRRSVQNKMGNDQ